MQKNIIGVDLGATSGRVILATLRGTTGSEWRSCTVFRTVCGRSTAAIYWDIHALYEEILQGIDAVAGGRGDTGSTRSASIRGASTSPAWMPTAMLAGASARLPRSLYRRSAGRVFPYGASRKTSMRSTGIQVMNFNSLYQLYALNARSTAPRWRPPSMCSSCPTRCRTCLRARQVCEYTILSTSQLMDPRTRELDGGAAARGGRRSRRCSPRRGDARRA